jgi:hypothetical protein
MKPIFTVHEGEFLVGDLLERRFPSLHIWVPSRDTGIDLLVTDRNNHDVVSLQVKSSRDFLPTHHPPEQRDTLAGCGWWKISRTKLASSDAAAWVLLLIGLNHKRTDCVIIEPRELLERLVAIHGKPELFQTYLWVTKAGRCFETRGLPKAAQGEITAGTFEDPARDFTAYLNDWACVAGLLHDSGGLRQAHQPDSRRLHSSHRARSRVMRNTIDATQARRTVGRRDTGSSACGSARCPGTTTRRSGCGASRNPELLECDPGTWMLLGRMPC